MIGLILLILLGVGVFIFIVSIITSVQDKIRQSLNKFLLDKLSKEDYLLYKKWDSPNILDLINFNGKIK